MLRNKSTKVFSETSSFFTSSDKGIYRIIELYRSLKLDKLKIGTDQVAQSAFLKGDLLLGLLLFPLFSISNVHRYCTHSLSQTLEAGKNTFYRFKNDSSIDWRRVVERCNRKLFSKMQKAVSKSNGKPKCLIIDDTDFEKTTYKTEHLGKIWSHVKGRQILGLKGLFLGYWDGKSFFALDSSLHKELGGNKNKPFGLSRKQKQKQFSKKRPKNSCGAQREGELLTNKIANAIAMVKRALKQGIEVDYLLMDSWFFCEAFLKMAKEGKTNLDIIGMVKMAKAKYEYQDKMYTAKELANLMKKRKKVKRVKALGFYCAEVIVTYKSIPLKFYFCKTSKHGKWHLLASTNTSHGILKAYELYSNRWTIEVFFKESKQYFGLGKSQSQDFDAQIADVSIAMIEYNVFSVAKRFEAYETMGRLFDQARDQATEWTISLRIWRFILELLEVFAENIDGDFNELIVRIMKNKPEDNKIFRLIEMQLHTAA